MSDGYTEEDVQLAADAMWAAGWGPESKRPAGHAETYARAALEALSAAGRLLPEGAEHDVKVVLRWYDGEGRLLDDWGAADVGTARRLGQRTHPSKAVRGEIRTRESWVGPWSVVEPVAVKEASDGA